MTESAIQDIRRRLTDLVRNPAHTYFDSPPEEITKYESKMTSFAGWSSAEIEGAEAELKQSFPRAYRTYLAAFGHSRGSLLVSADYPRKPKDFAAFKLSAIESQRESGGPGLPEAAIVISIYEGDQFLFIRTDDGDDPRVYRLSSGKPTPTEASKSVSEYVLKTLGQLESLREQTRASGPARVKVRDGSVVERQFGPSR